ncbi:MAG: hypothetical protein Tsb0013_17920 [Phycisphaerales bacterium]
MSTRELLELAALDAMGLLDEEERESFDTAFRAAAPELQARVRAEQARFANADHLLPPVEPPAGLRARVMAAVREAIASVKGDEPGVLASIGASTRTNTPMWRAACIGFATATAVLGVLYLTVAQQNRTMERMIAQDTITELIQDMGPRARQILMSPAVRPVAFTPSAPDVHTSVTASLYFDAETGEALLLCEGLPVANGTYTLTVRNGKIARNLQSIVATGGFVPVHVEGLTESELTTLTIDGPSRAGGSIETILAVGDL